MFGQSLAIVWRTPGALRPSDIRRRQIQLTDLTAINSDTDYAGKPG